MIWILKWLCSCLLAIALLTCGRAAIAAEPSSDAGAETAGALDPVMWGIYAEMVGTKWAGNGENAEWQWSPDGTIVESRTWMMKSVISRGANPGELVSVYGGGLHTYDGRIAGDGAVLWIRRGRFLKMPSRVSIVDGRFIEELVKLDQANQIAKVSSTARFTQTAGPNVAAAREARAATASTAAAPVTPALAVLPAASHVPVAAQAPAAAPLAAAPAPVASAAPVASTAPAVPKTGPRTLTAAQLATLRTRMNNDKVRRAQALSSQQAVAQQQRAQAALQMEQEQIAALEEGQWEEEQWEDEAPAATPNFAEVFLNTLNSELAKGQAEREVQDAFIRDVERQQRQIIQRREREEQRQQQAAAQQVYDQQAYDQQSAQEAQQASVARAEQAEREARVAEARERELVVQATAERMRQQQLREQSQARASGTAPARASPLEMFVFFTNFGGKTVAFEGPTAMTRAEAKAVEARLAGTAPGTYGAGARIKVSSMPGPYCAFVYQRPGEQTYIMGSGKGLAATLESRDGQVRNTKALVHHEPVCPPTS